MSIILPIEGASFLEGTSTSGFLKLRPACGSIEVSYGDNFVILADILEDGLSGAMTGAFDQTEINAKLTVNGNEVLISSFTYQKPTGRIGAILNVKLMKPDPTQIPLGANITFDLIVTTDAGPTAKRLMENGKLSGRDYTIKFSGGANGKPDDEVVFGAVDVIGNVFDKTPRRPIIAFDPDKIKVALKPTLSRDSYLLDDKGQPIYPTVIPVTGLTVYECMHMAYTGDNLLSRVRPTRQEVIDFINRDGPFMIDSTKDDIGIGFDHIFTNIPDYPISRVDWTIEGGWQGGILPMTSMYNPIYYIIDGTTLAIIDIDQPLPAGTTAKIITLAKHKSLGETYPFVPDKNSVEITQQYSARDRKETGNLSSTVRDVIDTATSSNHPFQLGYTITTTTTRYISWFATGDPTIILDEYILWTQTETKARVSVVENVVWNGYTYDTDENGEIVPDSFVDQGYTAFTHSVLATTSRETLYNIYKNGMKQGHVRRVEALINQNHPFLTPGTLETVMQEIANITWIDDPLNVGSQVQKYVVTEIGGLCYFEDVDSEIWNPYTRSFIQTPQAYPIQAAQEAAIINVNGQISWKQIETKTEQLEKIGATQYDVIVTSINHLTGSAKMYHSSPVTGENRLNPYKMKSRTFILRDATSEAAIGCRTPVQINAYELPRARAIRLGEHAIARFRNPSRTQPIELTGVDLSLDQGSVVKAQNRTGYSPNYVVTGFTISGSNLGRTGHRIRQSLETLELLATP